ncbi:MAG: DciA family protein [Actinomycetaceae bacterium]|nr:DciA family protein [Actinomycetaceae bacterium]
MNRVVREMTKSLGWERRISVASIAARWSEIIGAVNAEHCVVETFDDSILVIRTSSTAWANQMKILLPVVERRISEELGDGVVEKIVIRGPAAPSWKRGQWSVKGRGPRDTYG